MNRFLFVTCQNISSPVFVMRAYCITLEFQQVIRLDQLTMTLGWGQGSLMSQFCNTHRNIHWVRIRSQRIKDIFLYGIQFVTFRQCIRTIPITNMNRKHRGVRVDRHTHTRSLPLFATSNLYPSDRIMTEKIAKTARDQMYRRKGKKQRNSVLQRNFPT